MDEVIMEIPTLRAQIAQLIEQWLAKEQLHNGMIPPRDNVEAQHNAMGMVYRICADELAALRASRDAAAREVLEHQETRDANAAWKEENAKLRAKIASLDVPLPANDVTTRVVPPETELTRFIAKWQASLLEGSYGDSAWNMLRELQAFAGSPPPATWQPIETAPTGSGKDGPQDVRHPDYVEPPRLWLTLTDGQRCVGYFDWYYAEGGGGYDGGSGWVEGFSGERVTPTHWMPLPSPPAPPEQP